MRFLLGLLHGLDMKESQSSAVPVTELIAKVQTGDEEAIRQLWEHYFESLVKVARAKLRSADRRVADEEDAVQCALASFFNRAQRGKYEHIPDRKHLWRLLVKITCFKICDLARRRPRELGESALDNDTSPDHFQQGLSAWKDDKNAFPFDPSTMLQVNDTDGMSGFIDRLSLECRELLNKLSDEMLRIVAIRMLQDCTLKEIAKELNCAISTVERKVKRIREIWSREMS